MKFLHTSDWHIGQHFYSFDRDDEHRHFFTQLCRIVEAEQPDALLVSGDVFHNPAPSASAKQLFVEGVLSLHNALPQMVIVITAGNHDSATRLEAEQDLWRLAGVHVIGGSRRPSDDCFDPHQFIIDIKGMAQVVAVPYFHSTNYPPVSPDTPRDQRQPFFFNTLLSACSNDHQPPNSQLSSELCSSERQRSSAKRASATLNSQLPTLNSQLPTLNSQLSTLNSQLPLILMAHLAVQGCNTRGHDDEPVGGMMKDDLSLLGTGYDYLALGHIHMPQAVAPRAYYSGSALPVSFSEDYPHSVNIVEIARHGDMPTVRQIELPPLRNVKTIPHDGATFDEALQALQQFDDNDNSYLRLLVDQDDPLPADADDRAIRATQGKVCRFCDVIKKPRPKTHSDNTVLDVQEVDDLKGYSPLDIARRSYERSNGTPMSDTLLELMQQAIDNTRLPA